MKNFSLLQAIVILVPEYKFFDIESGFNTKILPF